MNTADRFADLWFNIVCQRYGQAGAGLICGTAHRLMSLQVSRQGWKSNHLRPCRSVRNGQQATPSRAWPNIGIFACDSSGPRV